jgi:hypothetical protein
VSLPSHGVVPSHVACGLVLQDAPRAARSAIALLCSHSR